MHRLHGAHTMSIDGEGVLGKRLKRKRRIPYVSKFLRRPCSWQRTAQLTTILLVLVFVYSFSILVNPKDTNAVIVVTENQSFIAREQTVRDHLRLATQEQTSIKIKRSDQRQLKSHTFSFSINEPHFCLQHDFLFLIFVCSSAENFEQRMAIRKSWGQRGFILQSNASVVFLLGKGKDHRTEKSIMEESMNFRDILQEDFRDSYKNLTLKSIMALKWCSSYCPGVKFMMKTDDDVYVNVPLLFSFLGRHMDRKRWIAGCIKQHVGTPLQMSTDGRTMKSTLPKSMHPAFVAGAGYIISGDIIEELYKASLRNKIIPVEDVFVTGHSAQSIGVRAEHYRGFSCGEEIAKLCSIKNSITIHRISARKQILLWKLLNTHNFTECESYQE